MEDTSYMTSAPEPNNKNATGPFAASATNAYWPVRTQYTFLPALPCTCDGVPCTEAPSLLRALCSFALYI